MWRLIPATASTYRPVDRAALRWLGRKSNAPDVTGTSGALACQSQRSGLNRRPPDYESGALPLSYAGGIHPRGARCCQVRRKMLPVLRRAMPKRGLEPRRLSAPPPQDGASTNFATWAFSRYDSGADGARTRDLRSDSPAL